MGATGLAADPAEYRTRLGEQDDAQIDAWAAEAMRDIAIRRGVLRVLADFRTAARIDDRSLERVYAAGGGPPATLGRDAQGRVMIPAISPPLPGRRDPPRDARRTRPADRVPGRELRGTRLRLTRAPGPSGVPSRVDRPGPAPARLGGLVRLGHPFPSLLDGLVTAVLALVAGASGARAAVLGVGDGRAPGVDRGPQRPRRRRSRPRPQAGQADPRRPRRAGDRPGRRRRRIPGRARRCRPWPVPCRRSSPLAGTATGYAYDLRLKATAWAWLPFAVGLPLLPVYAWVGATGRVPGAVRPAHPAGDRGRGRGRPARTGSSTSTGTVPRASRPRPSVSVPGGRSG